MKDTTKNSEEGDSKQKVDTTAEGENFSVLNGSAKTLCIPFNQPHLPAGTPCFTAGPRGTNDEAVSWCLWGRSY